MATYSGDSVVWKGEPIKAVIHIDSSTDYVVYSVKGYDNTNNFIKSVQFNNSEGNNRVNPLGIAASNSCSLVIFDEHDYLSPSNENSPYFGKLLNGIEIDLFISYDGTVWSNYGQFVATNFSGSYSQGHHGFSNISASDKLDSIGAKDLPDIAAYNGMYTSQLIGEVMTGIGLSSSDYFVDSRIDEQMEFGITAGKTVRSFINNICQLLLARCYINRDGVVCFVPALEPNEYANEFQLDEKQIGTLANKNMSNINYAKLRVKYLASGGTGDRAEIFRATRSLSVGINNISDIQFSKKALSIEQVKCLFDKGNSTAIIDNVYYSGFQNAIQLHVNVTGEAISSCEIVGSGVTISTTEQYVDVNVSGTYGGSIFEFDSQQIMTESKATSIANKLKSYLIAIGKNINMSDCVLTPRIQIGDKIRISNTETMYDGLYKITSQSISMGDDYNMSLTLIRVEEEEAA